MYCVVYTTYYTLLKIHCILYTIQYTIYNVYYILHTIQYTLHTSLFTIHYTLCVTHYTQRNNTGHIPNLITTRRISVLSVFHQTLFLTLPPHSVSLTL